MKKDDVIFTALFGNYDELKDLPDTSDSLNAICFTDNEELTSGTWKTQLVSSDLTPAMMNRKYKILAHRHLDNYQRSLYVDSSIEVLADPTDLFDKYLQNDDVVCPKHPMRNCIYSEGFECVVCGKAALFKTAHQVREYFQYGYPRSNGLTANGVMFRNHMNQVVIDLMERWWHETSANSQRDQISLPYVAWQNDIKLGELIEAPTSSNQYFRLHLHRHESILFLPRLISRIKKLCRVLSLGIIYVLLVR